MRIAVFPFTHWMDACEITFLFDERDGETTELQEGVWKGQREEFCQNGAPLKIVVLFITLYIFPWALDSYRPGS